MALKLAVVTVVAEIDASGLSDELLTEISEAVDEKIRAAADAVSGWVSEAYPFQSVSIYVRN